MGEDKKGNDIYVMGMMRCEEIVLRGFSSFMDIYNIPKDDIIFVSTLQGADFFTRIGGFLSRAIGLVFIGRPLTTYGIARQYKMFCDLVHKTKEKSDNIKKGNTI